MAVSVAANNGVDPRYGDWPYRFEIVPLDRLSVDATYQRPLTNFWKQVQEKFNPALVGTLIVSERKDDSLNVIDGQTRMVAMAALGIEGAPCLIYTGLKRPEEADLFADLQTKRRGMRTYDRFRAQLVAKQPMAVQISKIARDQGFQLDVIEESHTMKAIAALERAYKKAPEHLEDVLRIIRATWGTEDRDAKSGLIIGGLSTFLLTQSQVDEDRLIARLQDVTPKLILNRAAAIREGLQSGSGGAPSVAQAILSEYMRRR